MDRTYLRPSLAFLLLAVLTVAPGCSTAPSTTRGHALPPVPNQAYQLDRTLGSWVDTDTGYDTSRSWTLDGEQWPVALIMSPSQSPQFIVGERDGLFVEALKPFGIAPSFERIDLPPRTFHALQRSKWPFVYMPLAVFTDYCRGNANQGGAGGLQYVLLAGSTAGGGYTLLTKDPAIGRLEDLKGKLVAQVTTNPVQATLLTGELALHGMKLGDGPDDVRLSVGKSSDQLNKYTRGEVDAIIMLNVNKSVLEKTGSRALTDFADVTYRPNYTVLVVERSVLEKRPDVVKAFLEAHYKADRRARAEWTGFLPQMLASWNGYYSTQNADLKAARLQPDATAYQALLGNMWIEDRVDPRFLADCWNRVSSAGLWDWPGSVDTSRLADLAFYDAVLASHGDPTQTATGK